MDRADSDYAAHLEKLDRRFVLHPFMVLADHRPASPGIMVESLAEAFAGRPMLGEMRGMGLVTAVKFAAENTGKPRAFDPQLKVAARIAKKAFQAGVIVRALPAADTISFSLPFVTTKAQIDRCVEAVRKAADDVRDELTRERRWQAA